MLALDGEDEIEKQSWGPILIGTSASIVLLLAAYFFMSPKNTPPSVQPPDQALQFKAIHLIGREKGEKIWEIHARSGWATKNNQITILKEITSGATYRDGKPAVQNIRAPFAKIYEPTQKIEVLSTTEASSMGKAPQISAEINLAAPEKKPEFSLFFADQISYDRNTKVAEISGSVKFNKKNIFLEANKMRSDYKSNESLLYDNVRLLRKNQRLFCDRLFIWPDKDLMMAEGSLEARISGRETSRLTADKIYLRDGGSKNPIMEASGNVEVIQKNKAATSNHALYIENKKQLVMDSGVKSVIERAATILNQKTLSRLRSPESREMLRKKTYITCDRLIISTSNGDALLEGNVIVSQKGKEAKADRAEYNEKKDKITMTKNVFLKEEKKWIKTEKIIVDIKNEVFEAHEGVTGELKFKR